ncbi:MAG: metallophosphoesterase [Spirochaetaceae bacterium]|nr:metallophosphoesterase [Spirochaetaceae bacterium]
MNFILCADLHLKETEKEYSFSVLEEIIGLCEKKKCGALLLAGDVFDSHGAAEKLRAGFRAALEKLPSSCAVYFLPGNHEELRAGSPGSLENFDFGRAKLLAEKPWSLHSLSAEAELLAVPFQRDFFGYRDWKVPPKKKPLRILLAHGTVSGMAYTGPGEEADSILDEDLFEHFRIDLAALGHLHKQNSVRRKDVLIAYPGSARVWREGEEGKRCVFLGSTQTVPPLLEPLALARAGEYRVISVYAAPEGGLRMELPKEISPADWLHLEVGGVVEEEISVLAALEKLAAELKKTCRRVSSHTGKLSVLAGVSTHPLALRFLRAWEEAAPRYAEEEPGVYELARLRGLLALKEILETRK